MKVKEKKWEERSNKSLHGEKVRENSLQEGKKVKDNRFTYYEDKTIIM